MAWERLRRAREYVEQKIDRVERPVREWRERRERNVRREAQREYRETTSRAAREERSGYISHGLAEKRISRARERLERTKKPIESRVAKAFVGGATKATDVMYNPGSSERIRRGRKRAYDMVRGSSQSYNKTVPSAFGLGTGKGKRRKIDQSNWSMLTGSKKSGGASIGGGFGMLYGSGGGGGSRGSRKRRGGGGAGSDPNFWTVGY